MASKEQIQGWKNQIAEYKVMYSGLYPREKPTEKCLASFCKIHGIPWPLPDPEEEEPESGFDFLK